MQLTAHQVTRRRVVSQLNPAESGQSFADHSSNDVLMVQDKIVCRERFAGIDGGCPKQPSPYESGLHQMRLCVKQSGGIAFHDPDQSIIPGKT